MAHVEKKTKMSQEEMERKGNMQMGRKTYGLICLAATIALISGCGVINQAEARVAEGVSQMVEGVSEIAATEVVTVGMQTVPTQNAQIKETKKDYSASRPYKMVPVSAKDEDDSQESVDSSEETVTPAMEESDAENHGQKDFAKSEGNKAKKETKAEKVTKSEEQPTSQIVVVETVPTETEGSTNPVIVEALTTTTPSHTHEWTETNRSERIDCYAATKFTSVDYVCACGETKTETMEEPSDCDWQWVGEWEHGYTDECHIWRFARHMCVVHGTETLEFPKFEEQDNHDYRYGRIEPSCTEKGEVWVACPKCKTYFPELYETITNETYPDGGGNGHVFVETSRRELEEVEGWWYGEDKVMATFTCTVCGMSYNDVVDR